MRADGSYFSTANSSVFWTARAGTRTPFPSRASRLWTGRSRTGASRVAGIIATTARLENTWSRMKNGSSAASAMTGFPLSSDQAYGVRVEAPQDEPQRYRIAVSTPESMATKDIDRNAVSANWLAVDPPERPRWR